MTNVFNYRYIFVLYKTIEIMTTANQINLLAVTEVATKAFLKGQLKSFNDINILAKLYMKELDVDYSEALSMITKLVDKIVDAQNTLLSA